ncbi:MAG: hypothetical protein ACXWPM_04175 [Bdellovibrionota bacterium]
MTEIAVVRMDRCLIIRHVSAATRAPGRFLTNCVHQGYLLAPMSRNAALIFIPCFLFVASCNGGSGGNAVAPPASPPLIKTTAPDPLPSAPPVALTPQERWRQRWWLQKASRALRGGDELAPGENADKLLQGGREAAVASFVADPRFADTILDFNMAYIPADGDDEKSAHPELPGNRRTRALDGAKRDFDAGVGYRSAAGALSG